MAFVRGVVPLIAAAAALLLTFASESHGEAAVTSPPQPTCPKRHENWGKYHGDDQCNRASFNRFKESLNRRVTYKSLVMSGAQQVPLEKTVTCPLMMQDMVEPNQISGFDTMWLVENAASTAVVLSYMKNGVEYSALNSNITPPQADPQAILQPGEYKAIYTYEGHSFVARELKWGGILGDVLLQHRVGLVPVGIKAAATAVMEGCLLDHPEPRINNTHIAKEFERTPTEVLRPCHTLDVGFRNMAGCPLHAYFITSGKDGSCKENFKFHLGVNPTPQDFMLSWNSPTKYEGSFVGHTFAFRLASDPNVLVDQITLTPTRITDCPRGRQAMSVTAQAESVTLPIVVGLQGFQQNVSGWNSTGDLVSFSALNAAASFYGLASV